MKNKYLYFLLLFFVNSSSSFASNAANVPTNHDHTQISARQLAELDSKVQETQSLVAAFAKEQQSELQIWRDQANIGSDIAFTMQLVTITVSCIIFMFGFGGSWIFITAKKYEKNHKKQILERDLDRYLFKLHRNLITTLLGRLNSSSKFTRSTYLPHSSPESMNDFILTWLEKLEALQSADPKHTLHLCHELLATAQILDAHSYHQTSRYLERIHNDLCYTNIKKRRHIDNLIKKLHSYKNSNNK